MRMVLGKKYCTSLEWFRSCSADSLCKVVRENASYEKVRLVITLRETCAWNGELSVFIGFAKKKWRSPQARSIPAANVSPSTAAIFAGVQEVACSGFYKFDVKSLEMFEKCFWNGCLSIM